MPNNTRNKIAADQTLSQELLPTRDYLAMSLQEARAFCDSDVEAHLLWEQVKLEQCEASDASVVVDHLEVSLCFCVYI